MAAHQKRTCLFERTRSTIPLRYIAGKTDMMGLLRFYASMSFRVQQPNQVKMLIAAEEEMHELDG